jgi:hypothetical protein
MRLKGRQRASALFTAGLLVAGGVVTGMVSLESGAGAKPNNCQKTKTCPTTTTVAPTTTTTVAPTTTTTVAPTTTTTTTLPPGVQRATFRLGPFTLAPEGSPGSESEATQNNIPKPAGDFGIVGMTFDVVHTDGTAEGHHNVHLHHTVFMDGSRPDSICPSLPNRFVGAGAERTPVSFGTEYAYKVGASDSWAALWHIMNMSTATHTVYIQYVIDYVTGAELAARKPLTSYFYDVDNCWGDSAYNVPGGGGPGSIHTKSITYTAPRNGTRLYTGGHLHQGGIDLILEQNGTEVCRPTAIYMDGMLDAITYCDTPVSVTAGTTIRLTSRYSNEAPLTAVMGISVSYVWEP